MNVYDFDGTIYDGDSTVDFYLFCLRKRPQLTSSLLANSVDAIRFLAHRLESKEFKERFLGRILPRIAVGQMVEDFWKTYKKRVKKWYLEAKRPDDVIISASPEFLLRPICDDLGVELIATDMDVCTGAIVGNNMRGEEKVRAFRSRFGNTVPDAFYTDSMSDAPMMDASCEAYLVKGSYLQKVKRDSFHKDC